MLSSLARHFPTLTTYGVIWCISEIADVFFDVLGWGELPRPHSSLVGAPPIDVVISDDVVLIEIGP
jgi:hypothetical protein